MFIMTITGTALTAAALISQINAINTHIKIFRLCCCILIIIGVAITIGIMTIVSILVPIIWLQSPDVDLSDADTCYSANETRLVEVSAFFKEQVGISVVQHFNANATLYIMKQLPPLTTKYSFSVSTIVTYDEYSSYSRVCWHYYLHRKSNVTLQGCVNPNCDPYHIYIVKGQQKYATWLKTPHNEKSAFVNTQICSYGLSSFLNYTVKEDDHYYFFYYSTGQCHGDDIFSYKNQAGNLSLYIEKFEYSISNLQFDGACNTYELDSCTLNLPLQIGSVRVLIAARGQSGDEYDVTFTSTMRKWPIPFIVISCVVFLACTKTIIVCWLCHCKKKRERRQYEPMQ